jgi:hypothetical protein
VRGERKEAYQCDKGYAQSVLRTRDSLSYLGLRFRFVGGALPAV